jgi:hypothetical protein
MYGGRYVVKSDLFGGERTRGILRCQLCEGDILLASDERECKTTYAYEITANGVCDLASLESKEGDEAQRLLYSVLGCYKFAVLRPSMI